ncbi:MAG TPA: S53 family peptidase [Streptosporangiaceae bacterium]|nr:S53 family peptidase [Streptosporangiaceae bacterium]
MRDKRGVGALRKHTTITIAATACALAIGGTATAAVTAAGTAGGTAVGAAAGAATATGAAKAAKAQPDFPAVTHAGMYYIRHVSPDDPPTTTECQALFQINCYDPAQVEQAYNLTSLYNRGTTGKGRTIALIDVFGSPTIDADLTEFDNFLGMPAPQLKVIAPVGGVPGYDDNNADMVGWAGETTLDVEYAHAAAPGAKILLVEVPNEDPQKILGAEQDVINHHLADVISQSFGWTEQVLPRGFAAAMHSVYSNAAKHHITVLASAGDTGAANTAMDGQSYYTYPTATWPATDPLVTAVGGTALDLGTAGNRAGRDTVWNDTYNKATNNLVFGEDGPNPLATGGGKSVAFRRPSYQNSVKKITGNARGIPDISMSGACSAAVNVYQSFGGEQPGWYAVCGTSESAPLFAGVVALAAQQAGHDLGAINPALYKLASGHAKGIITVTQGNNTVSFSQNSKSYTVHGYYARNGYSLVAGVGTINAQYFVPELAKLG